MQKKLEERYGLHTEKEISTKRDENLRMHKAIKKFSYVNQMHKLN